MGEGDVLEACTGRLLTSSREAQLSRTIGNFGMKNGTRNRILPATRRKYFWEETRAGVVHTWKYI